MLEYHLDLWTWLNSVQMRTPTGSRWTSNNYITRCHRRLELVSSSPVRVQFQLQLESVGTRCPRKSQLQTWALSDPRLGSPARMRKKCCYGHEKNLGSICYSLSPSPTHLSHTTNINPFENKVWEVYFYKEVCSFVHWSSYIMLTMFPHIVVYVCV